MPNRKQSKEKIGKLNDNQYHKDHFEYNYELDAFKCPGENIYTSLENILVNTRILKN